MQYEERFEEIRVARGLDYFKKVLRNFIQSVGAKGACAVVGNSEKKTGEQMSCPSKALSPPIPSFQAFWGIVSCANSNIRFRQRREQRWDV